METATPMSAAPAAPAMPAAPAAPAAPATAAAAARPDESNVRQDKGSAGGEEDVSIETAVEEAENGGGGAISYSQVCLVC